MRSKDEPMFERTQEDIKFYLDYDATINFLEKIKIMPITKAQKHANDDTLL